VPLNVQAREAARWYKKNRIFYQTLANKVEVIVRELLELNKINYHSVTSRAKTTMGYLKKASKEKYKDPRSEIMDMAGIRVTTYTDSEAKMAAKIIKRSFEVNPKFSVDKTEELGVDKVGYRGIHYVANLGEQRLRLPENSMFRDFVFEIQIRSILQHAWAEFEHDRNYKFSGILPKEIRRRLSLAAANLESVDRDFDEISSEIDNYTKNVEKGTRIGKLNIPINSTSLITYLKGKFQPLIEQGLLEPTFNGEDKTLLQELQIMKIDDLAKLESIIPIDFAERAGPYYERNVMEGSNFLGLMRDILIIYDAETYFNKAWRGKWSFMDKQTLLLCQSYSVDAEKYIEKLKIDMM
jgi:putative GTP pyrophosphokinase